MMIRLKNFTENFRMGTLYFVKHDNSATHLEFGKYTYECKIGYSYREILWPKLVEATNYNGYRNI